MRWSPFVVAVACAATACTGGTGAEKTAQPASYRIVYLVEEHDGASVRATTVVTDVFPPYRARTVTHEGRTAHGSSLGGFAWDETALYSLGADGAVLQTEYVAPGFPGPASGLDVALPVALRQHLVASLGPGSAGDRPCTRWLSRMPLDGAALAPATPRDRAESCVDSAGRLLSDTWTINGTVVRTRLAIEVGDGPSLTGRGLFDGRTPVPLPTSDSGFVVRPSDAATLARLLALRVPAAPAGLTPDKAVAALDLNAQRQGFSREAAVLTWTGPDRLAVLRIERDLGGGERTLTGAPVALGALGTGRLEPVLAGLRVTVKGDRGLLLIATADLPEPELLTWLRSLQL